MASMSPSHDGTSPWTVEQHSTPRPGRRVARFFKHTWDRFCYSPSARRVVGRLSSLAPLRGWPDANRTRLADPELGLTRSQVDFLTDSLETPTIRDPEWRRFTDTGTVSSPSSFLGAYSRSSSCETENDIEEVTEVESPTWKVIPPDAIGSSSGIYVELDDAMEALTSSSSHSMSFLGRSRRSSQSSAGTTSHQILHRHVRSSSDPCLSTTATLDELSKRLGDIHMSDTAICAELDQAQEQEQEEQWSVLSTLPSHTESHNSSSSNVSQRPSGHCEKEQPKTPGSGTKRKSSFCMVGKNGPMDHNANDSASKKRKISIRPQDTSQEDHIPTARDHPRYSGVFTMEPHWRVVGSERGPLMVPSSPRTAGEKSASPRTA